MRALCFAEEGSVFRPLRRNRKTHADAVPSFQAPRLRRRDGKCAEARRQRDRLCAQGLVERDRPVVVGTHVVDQQFATSLVTCLLSQPLDHRTSKATRAHVRINLDLLQDEAFAGLEPAVGAPYPAAIKPRFDDVVPPLLALFEAPVCFPLERGCFQSGSTWLRWPHTRVTPGRAAAWAKGVRPEGARRIPVLS